MKKIFFSRVFVKIGLTKPLLFGDNAGDRGAEGFALRAKTKVIMGSGIPLPFSVKRYLYYNQ